jgi:hypothetical protein
MVVEPGRREFTHILADDGTVDRKRSSVVCDRMQTIVWRVLYGSAERTDNVTNRRMRIQPKQDRFHFDSCFVIIKIEI